jgi:signal transduction histidine kinase
MSLTLRLTLTYLLIALAGVLLLGAGFIALTGRHLAAERERELGAQATIYAALLGELAATPAALQALAPAGPGVELLAAGTAARVFSTAGALLAGDPALGPFPSRAALALMRPPVPLPASQVAGRLYAAQPIMGAAGAIGVVELSSDTAAEARLIAALRRLALQAAIAAAAVAAVVSLLVARSIARPILQLTRRAEALASTLDEERGARGQGPAAEGQRLARPWALALRLPSLGGKNEIAGLSASLASLDAGLRSYTARIAELEQTRARFYRGVSHELRTPLTAIRAGLENLADGALPSERPAITLLEGEAARLSRLVEELLADSARASAGPYALAARGPLDLSALAAEVCALLRGRAERAGVELSAAGAPLELRGDRDRLKQALINLVDNALRVTPPGGAVLVATLRAGGSQDEAKPLRARLAVMDGGPGVPAELRGRIWELGVRGGDEATDGSAGLGLAIVREIAVAHGGSAYLDERYGPGARFVIELPLEERSNP